MGKYCSQENNPNIETARIVKFDFFAKNSLKKAIMVSIGINDQIDRFEIERGKK